MIAEKLGLNRDAPYNRTDFFEEYTALCSYETECKIPTDSSIITSDDVFDFMLNLRTVNNGIDEKREDLFKDYLDTKYSGFQMKSLEDYEQLKKVVTVRSKTQSHYVRTKLMDAEPVDVKKWTQLSNVRAYYNFFKQHENEF